jgi:hypothetical protein
MECRKLCARQGMLLQIRQLTGWVKYHFCNYKADARVSNNFADFPIGITIYAWMNSPNRFMS